jgi:hypothetical protein
MSPKQTKIKCLKHFCKGDNLLVKIFSKDNKELKFDRKDVEDKLKAAGLPQRVAEEVAERVDKRVEDGWTVEKIDEETDIELRRLEEDIDRAHETYKGKTSMGPYNVGESRMPNDGDNYADNQPRSESKVELRSVEK